MFAGATAFTVPTRPIALTPLTAIVFSVTRATVPSLATELTPVTSILTPDEVPPVEANGAPAKGNPANII
jgi:hypothetical protein